MGTQAATADALLEVFQRIKDVDAHGFAFVCHGATHRSVACCFILAAQRVPGSHGAGPCVWTLNHAHRKMKAPSPEDAKCKFCRRRFTARGVKEHERHQCTKSEQTAAQVQEESVPSLWKGSSGPRGPGAPRGIRQIPLGESPSYERDAERQRRCEEGGTQESYETTRGVQSCTALTRGLCGAPGRQRETRAETTERIWEEVRKRTPLQTEERRQEICVAVNRKRHDTGEVV